MLQITRSFSALAAFNKERCLPLVSLVSKNTDSHWRLHVINSDISQRVRVLQYLNDDVKVISPGEYTYFKGMIKVEDFDK